MVRLVQASHQVANKAIVISQSQVCLNPAPHSVDVRAIEQTEYLYAELEKLRLEIK